MLTCFLYLFIGLIIGIILHKTDCQLDIVEFGIVGNTFLWPITFIVSLSLILVYFLVAIVEWGDDRIANIIDKIWK